MLLPPLLRGAHFFLVQLQLIHVTRDQFFSENEMNIRIPLCNVQHLNGMLNISLEIFLKKDALTENKKGSKYLGNNC